MTLQRAVVMDPQSVLPITAAQCSGLAGLLLQGCRLLGSGL